MEAQTADQEAEGLRSGASTSATAALAEAQPTGCPWHLVSAMLDATGDGIMVMDERGTLLLANARALHLLGARRIELPCSAREALGTLPSRWLGAAVAVGEAGAPGGADTTSSPLLRAAMDLEPGQAAELVLGSVEHGGLEHVVQLRRERWTGADREPMGWVLRLSDLSDRRRAEAAILELALLDPLTALPNRSLLLDRLEQALLRLRRSRKLLAVAFLDVDDFKAVNDGLGHAAGDELLVQIARRLSARLRPDDTLGRLGGDEFLILCENLHSRHDAEALAHRMADAFAEPFELARGVAIAVQASIGVVVGGAGSDSHELVAAADGAMYAAKQRGAPVVGDEPAGHERGARLSVAETLLRRALEDPSELRLRYQPIVDVVSGKVRAFEAAVELRSDGEVMSHRQLLSTAQAVGELGRYASAVLERIGADHSAWTERLGPTKTATVSIGLHVARAQAQCPTFPDVVAEGLERSRLLPTHLVVQMTEATVGRLFDAVRSPVVRLAEQGVRLALDEFGSGLSSLALLRRLPFDLVKLQLGQVSGHDELEDERQRRLFEALTISSRLLGSAVVGRGVGSPRALEVVRALGCSMAQGPLFGPSVDRDGALASLASPVLPGWESWTHQERARHPSA